MPVVAINAEELASAWEFACRHAGYPIDGTLRLYYVPGPPSGEARAIHLHPGEEVVFEADRFPFAKNQLADANSPERLGGHRIAIRDLPDVGLAVAVLRHELEHARQYDYSVSLYLSMGLVQDVVGRAFRETSPETLEGSGLIYNALPHERDANGAGAIAAGAYSHGPTSESDSTFAETQPPDLDSLATRLVSWCAMFPSVMADECRRRNVSVTDALSEFSAAAPEWWAKLMAEEAIPAAGRAALDVIPTAADVAGARTPQDAWRPAAEHLRHGERSSRELLS